ncbi:MAG: UDPGP type 1 family protein [Lachnospiraceae bacterium]|nr:UDPGP type 1 family protein [Lachnospiraceae bacterium]
MTYQEALEKLSSCHQEHLLKYYDELNEAEKQALLSQIEKLDLSLLSLLSDEGGAREAVRGTFAPLGATTVEEIDEKRAFYEEEGLKAIRAGKTGAVLLAGGQGTRLGFDKPKGMFNIGVDRELYIFECLINNLMDVVREAGVYIPLYIMTSEINNEDTVRFFKEKDFFGYDPAYVNFFIQDMAPCVGYDRKILMENKGKIASSPNGNGGWYASLKKAGLDEDLKKRGVEYLSVFAVDNVCQRINDPAWIGAVVSSGLDCGGKVVRKADPNERVGVLCLEDGKPSIVEYYEMTDDMINLRDKDGNLLYAFGVILNYLFKVEKLEEIAGSRMMTHVVEKKIPYMDENGVFVKPDKPNGYKFELLVLDMIHMMDSCLSYEVVRNREFAPVKNAAGVDSVESARKLLLENGVEL